MVVESPWFTADWSLYLHILPVLDSSAEQVHSTHLRLFSLSRGTNTVVRLVSGLNAASCGNQWGHVVSDETSLLTALLTVPAASSLFCSNVISLGVSSAFAFV